MAPAKAIDKRWHQVNLRNGKEFELEEAEDRVPHLAVKGLMPSPEVS